MFRLFVSPFSSADALRGTVGGLSILPLNGGLLSRRLLWRA
jgi:hypothetical protein